MTFIHSLIFREVRRIEIVASVVAVCLALALAGCGSSSSLSTPKTSGLTKRVLVSNQSSGVLHLIDAQKDQFASTIAAGGPTRLISRSIVTAVIDANSNTIPLIDDPSEKVKLQPAMAGPIDDIALSSDGRTAYAAMRNLNQLAIINVPDGTFVTVAVPGVTRLVLSPNNSKLLAFSDDAQNLPGLDNTDAFYVIDAVSHVASAVNSKDYGVPVGGQPYSAVFTDNSHAFILNCAVECGGISNPPPAPPPQISTLPSIQLLDLTTPTPTLGPPIPLPVTSAGVPLAGATVGLLSGPNLFIAGTPTAGAGSLVVFNTTSNTFSTVLAIQDGLHTRMAMTSNGHLYVGSLNCLALPSGSSFQGCLAILDTTKGVNQSSLVFPVFSSFRTTFSVTGLQPISGRNVIYVVEGGELDIFDITTNALTPTQIDVVGKAIDVVQIDP